MPKVSVIVPVYNAEDFLLRCINSIQSQSLSDIEIVIIDDGSTDKTSMMCSNLMNEDDRIKYLYQENSGVAAARQKGVDVSTGEFIIHVDSDDWIEPTMLDEMYNEAVKEKADVVICDMLFEYDATNNHYYSQIIEKKDSESIFIAMIYGSLMCSLVNKLIKREVIDRYNIRLTPGLNTGEDLLYCCSLYRHNIQTAFVSKAFYHYDLHTNSYSITRNISKEKVKQRVRVAELLFDGFDENLYFEERNYLLWKNIEMAFFSDCDRDYFYSLFNVSQKTMLIEKEKRGINNFFTKKCVIHALNGHLITARRINKAVMCVLKPIRKLIK